jgi:hypothetical protein
LLVGFTTDWGNPVCVAPDVTLRLRSDHRFSILFHVGLLQQASRQGWAEYHSKSDEVITAFHPRLLPAYVLVRDVGVQIPAVDVANAIEDSGLMDVEGDAAKRRATAAIMRAIRDAKFARNVVKAYRSECGLCGFNWGLIEAAHIYPVAAPGSPDEVWNGIGMCGNHHAFFDSYKLHIHPDSFAVTVHPELIARANQIGRSFLQNTFRQLRLPTSISDRPRPAMLRKRYDWFRDAYEWV